MFTNYANGSQTTCTTTHDLLYFLHAFCFIPTQCLGRSTSSPRKRQPLLHVILSSTSSFSAGVLLPGHRLAQEDGSAKSSLGSRTGGVARLARHGRSHPISVAGLLFPQYLHPLLPSRSYRDGSMGSPSAWRFQSPPENLASVPARLRFIEMGEMREEGRDQCRRIEEEEASWRRLGRVRMWRLSIARVRAGEGDWGKRARLVEWTLCWNHTEAGQQMREAHAASGERAVSRNKVSQIGRAHV